ncbi:hypothetical protein [Cryptosporangium arvum]|uniref:DUF2637 domain-containing protein n=1 Tax=Cryptosporangium arvum DSM 44712 TaxID=927661 RepID=A0A011AAW6_9ACTN|nr:hypothetical protein [Cryptosporangium arvum]EXG79166.1 hypothetical protein CryarDRAFT_0192 [Cryptosporangium arvum DSM 44712]
MSKFPTMGAGRGWAYVALVLGGGVSIAANVAHSFIPPAAPEGTADPVAWAAQWSPEPGAVLLSVVWPVFLFIAVEVLAKPSWPSGRWWRVLRFGGMLPVAAVAAIVSYRHLSGLLEHYGEDTVTVALGPLAVDGLMAMATGALIATAHRAAVVVAEATAAPADPVTVPEMPAPAPAIETGRAVSAAPAAVEATPPPRPRTPRKPDTATAVARLRAKNPEITQAEAAKRLGVTDRTIRRYWNPAPVEPASDPAAAPVAA